MITKIIIEGPNNVGKTTFINNLLRTNAFNDWKIIHMSGADDNSFKRYDELLTSNEKFIFDRAHIGEMIYPQYYKRHSQLSMEEFDILCEKYKNNVLYIFVNADFNFIQTAYKNKNEILDYALLSHEKTLFAFYSDVLKHRGCITYNIYNER